jgi:methionine sulfoxide reductase catalytic subunit
MKREMNFYSLPSSEITDEQAFRSRRKFIQAAGIASAASVIPQVSAKLTGPGKVLKYRGEVSHSQAAPDWLKGKLNLAKPGRYSTRERATPYEYVTQYNNFYEFGTDKGDPSDNAGDFISDPWSLVISGEAEVTGKITLEDILKPHDLEERIYRLRCVEAWSMVVPWIGFPLADLIKRFKPTSDARFVRFETLYDPAQMPGQRSKFTSIDYPYVEGLRIDEAVNELAFIAVGVYGNSLPPQNGAPLRLVVPWKYGFKSIKSIAKISFTRKRPKTTWERTNFREYGFYANVNPAVDHPRWSQASERRLPSSLFSPNRIETIAFNGYGPQVASLYSGMDLKRYY